MPYPNKQAVVDDLLPPGWRLVGDAPNMVSGPNPDAGKPGQPPTITQQQGIVLSVQGPAGTTPDTIVIKQIGNAPWKGGVGYDVVRGPENALPKDTSASPTSNLVRLDANFEMVQPGQKATYIVDPKAPAGAQPLKLEPGNETGDPTKWQTRDFNGATVVWDPNSGKVVATVPASAQNTAARSGVYVNVTDPNDPKRVIGMTDQGSKEFFPISQQAGKQVVTTPTKILVLNTDGTVAQEHAIEAQPSLVTLGNEVFVFDPATKSFAPGPKGTTPVTVGISTNNEFYTFFDEEGKEVGRTKNPSYKPTQTQPGPQSLSAPKIPKWNQTTGEWDMVPNEGRLTIGQVTQDLIKDLTGKTVDPNNPLTLDEAKLHIETAISKMNAEAQQASTAAGAAQNVLTGQQQGAQTGAGMLQQRAQTAQNLVQQGLGILQSPGGRYGNYSGGLLSPVPGMGEALVSGAANFATELGGGQAVYDTAVRMVQAADPNGQNPDRATAVATLTQIMDRYRKDTGQDFPSVAATKALLQSQASNGVTAPATLPTVSPTAVSPEVFQAQFDPRLNPAFPQQPVGTVLPAGVAGTVPLDDPRRARPRSAADLGFVAPETIVGALQGG